MLIHDLRLGHLAACIAIFLALLAGGVSAVRASATELNFCFAVWRPFTQVDDGEVSGITVTILRKAAQRAGFSVQFHELPWNRCLHHVREGDFDAVLDAAERPVFLQGPTSIAAYTNTFWVHADNTLSGLDLADMAGTTIGLVEGYVYPSDLLAQMSEADITIDYAIDDASNLHKLVFGRVDAVIADMVGTLAIAREQNLKIRALEPTHSIDRLYLSFHKDRIDEQARFDAAIRELLDEGFVEQVYLHWLGVGLSDLGLE